MITSRPHRAHAVIRIAILVAPAFVCAAAAQDALPPGGEPVVGSDALLTTPVGGLERSRGTQEVVAVSGMPFARALRVSTRARAPERNSTQLTIHNAEPVSRGDALLAAFHVRGASAGGDGPARLEFLFEQSTSPWMKSVTRGVTTVRPSDRWTRVLVPFVSAGDYAPGGAMVSFRFGFDPQTLEVGGLRVANYGTTRTIDELRESVAEHTPLGEVTVNVDLGTGFQILDGFGGNFAQPRYGAAEPMDAIGRYNLDHLRVVHARVGIPLNHWAPERGVYRDAGPAHAALQQMQVMATRKIPITGSIWEGPTWLLPGRREESRMLPRANYGDCIEAIARFLLAARDTYGARVDYISFNEPDYGVNFRFTPAELAAFIREAGPRFAEMGLTTRFLTADTANGDNFAAYARPLLEDAEIAPYLGPLAFHCWDALGAPDIAYREIAALGRQYSKPVWCTEAGHDSALWQSGNPWPSWENALRTAQAYARTLRLSGASLMDYWTYQDNYPLVSRDGTTPFPVWRVLRQMEQALPPGARIAAADDSNGALEVLAAAGPAPGGFALLLINPSGPGQVTVTGLPGDAVCTVIQSTAAAQGRTVGEGMHTDNLGRFTLDLPARSVTTLSSAVAGTSMSRRSSPGQTR